MAHTRIIVENNNNEILLLQRNNNKWEFPGGRIERGEHCTEGAIRELHEETGISMLDKNLKYVHKLSTNYRQVFLVESISDKIIISEEHISFMWLSFNSIKDLLEILTDSTKELVKWIEQN